MRSFIVGTAGHIDHGKSALVRALTGTDPDRLKEEKERGITIDLGFAHMSPAEGVAVSFIDVPGHERFVRNMLAGAHGIDAVLLVVAADESVMPQTREHFHICRLLGVRRGLVAFTKIDVADEESRALAALEVRELVKGSFLEGAPCLDVSARTGEGIGALAAALRALAGSASERPSGGLLRLPVDRSFTLRGFGTVATGTLVSGAVAVGEEIEVMPSAKRGRVRGLQVHGQPVDRVGAGNRVAVNLSGLDVSDLRRGDVLARPGTLRPTSLIDVELSLLPGERSLKDQSRVRVHLASAEVLARVRLGGGRALEPGATATAQLRLERPAVAGRGDSVILRSYSPAWTIGGARVLDPLPPKRGRRELPGMVGGAPPADDARRMIEAAEGSGIELPALAARLTVPAEDLAEMLREDATLLVFGRDPATVVSRAGLERLRDAVLAQLDEFHLANPLKPAMSREALRRRVFSRAPAGAMDHVLSELTAAGAVRAFPDAVARAGHEVRLTPAEASARAALLEAAGSAGLAGIEASAVADASRSDPRLFERVARVLLDEGRLRRVGEALLVDDRRLEELKDEVRRRWPPGSRLDVAAFKDMTGLSRKFVIPLLEFLDRERVTRRSGNERLVLG
jgi:selenocysteine-specific elongation factor